jgi:hypothetical protein
MTLYGGYQFSRLGEVLVSAEEAGGLGLSSALGIAAFPNLDAVRDATLMRQQLVAGRFRHCPNYLPVVWNFESGNLR